MCRPTHDLHDLVPHLTDTDFDTARGPDAGKTPCSCHQWGRITVEECGSDPTAFRCCEVCGQLEDCNLALLAECILSELSGVPA